MRRFLKSAMASLALFSTAAGSPSRMPDPEARHAVRLAANEIERGYVDARSAGAIANALKKAEPSFARRRTQGDQLARDLTELLRSVSADPHFRIAYSADPMPPDIFAPKSSAGADAAASKTARINNFGVLRAERLPGNIGFIDLDQFTDPALMRGPLAAAMELLKHCDAMIVDLRYNEGGQARGAALTASYFLPQTPKRLIVTLQTRDPGQKLEIRTEEMLESPRFLDRPVYILTSARTFSAAEMFASVLQDSGRAQVVGERSRGGGNPVTSIRLTPHYALLLPTTSSVLANGKSWEGVGVIPDIPATERDALAAAQRAALIALLAARRGDMLAENWRGLLDKIDTAPSNPTPNGKIQ